MVDFGKQRRLRCVGVGGVIGAGGGPSSRLPGFPVLAFLVWNVFIAAFVPEMAACCSPEVTLVSVDWPTTPRSGHRGGKSQVNRFFIKFFKKKKKKRRCGSGRGLPSSHRCLLRGRDARLQWNGHGPGGAAVRVAHHQPGVLDVETLPRRRRRTGS